MYTKKRKASKVNTIRRKRRKLIEDKKRDGTRGGRKDKANDEDYEEAGK